MTRSRNQITLDWGILRLVAVVGLVAGCATSPSAPSVPSSAGIPSGPEGSLAMATAMPVSVASAEPTETAEGTVVPGDGGQFEPPAPTCPSPPGAVIVPDVRVSVGDNPSVIAGRGSSTFSTCTTTAAADVAGQIRVPWLRASHRDRIRLQVQTGWRIILVEGFDAPARGDGGMIERPIDLPDGPDRVDVIVPTRDGDTRVDWTLWLVRVDGKAVGTLQVGVGLHLPPAG